MDSFYYLMWFIPYVRMGNYAQAFIPLTHKEHVIPAGSGNIVETNAQLFTILCTLIAHLSILYYWTRMDTIQRPCGDCLLSEHNNGDTRWKAW